MGALDEAIRAGRRVPAHRPWSRAVVSRDGWEQAAHRLHAGEWALVGLWGERDFAHMAVFERESGDCAVLSYACEGNRFPAVGRMHSPAIRLERAMRDLVGLEPEGLADTRAWLDHGKWNLRHPLGPAGHAPAMGNAYPFLPAEGESLHQIPVGPVHAGIIEPGHFRFTANGETVVRLEERLGYVHKGIESLMAGASIQRAAVLAGRVSGDSTVACALAFARAVEAALDVAVPPRAVWLRALQAELERLANHCGDIGAICNDAAFAMMHAQCGLLREQVLRAAEACFGHRLMMDRVVPGGVARDLRMTAAICGAHRGDSQAARAGRALRQHRLAPGPHRRHGPGVDRAGAAVRRRRLRRARRRTRVRCPMVAGLPTLRPTALRGAGTH
jgi:Ni,Fe-hydrogenase III component G